MPSKPLSRLTTSVAASLLLFTNVYAQQSSTNTNSTGPSASGATPPGTSSTPLSATLPTVNVGNAAMPGGSGQSTGTTGRGGSGSRRTTQRNATTSLGLGSSSLGAGVARGANTSIQTNRQNDRRAQFVFRPDFGPAAAVATPTAEVAATVEHTLAAVVPTGITVAVEGSTAVLTGAVPSVQDRKLAEQMALLEPGVRAVRNELVVQSKP